MYLLCSRGIWKGIVAILLVLAGVCIALVMSYGTVGLVWSPKQVRDVALLGWGRYNQLRMTNCGFLLTTEDHRGKIRLKIVYHESRRAGRMNADLF